MKNLLITLCMLFAMGTLNVVQAQHEAEEGSSHEEHTFRPHHSLGFSVNHTNIREAVRNESEGVWLSVPSLGLDYTFVFHPKWAVGLHTDFITEEFLVDSHLDDEEGKMLERSYPVAPAVVLIFKPNHHWSIKLGPGVEFAAEENLSLLRTGLEYAYPFAEKWEVYGTFSYDFRFNAFDDFSFGIGVARVFGKE